MQQNQVLGFSIVVPTHGRTGLVECLLASLDRARARFKGESEILVVDSSPTNEAMMIHGLCNRWRAEYAAMDNSLVRKRNSGIRKARYEIVLFIDSDCEADPELLKQHSAVYREAGPDVAGVAGLTRWKDERCRMWPLLEIYSPLSASFSLAAWLPEVEWATCTNLSVRRQALLDVGGFNERWRLKVYGEDVDLGLRLQGRGYRILCNPQALVLHDCASIATLRALVTKAFRTGRADYHLGETHSDRLQLEFPTPLATSLLLLIPAAALWARGGSAAALSIPALWLVLFSVVQAVLATGVGKGGARVLAYRAAAGLLEMAFELGKLVEALPRLRLHRLWTKFVYVRQQLAAERARRILQMWALLLSLLLTLPFIL